MDKAFRGVRLLRNVSAPKRINVRLGSQNANQRRQDAPEHGAPDSVQISPESTKPFQSQKTYLQNAIREVASYAQSPEQFGEDLKKYYGIQFKISRGRFSYLHPERKKYMTGRTLGDDFTKGYLIPLFEGNRNAGRTREQSLVEPKALPSQGERSANEHDNRPAYDPSYDYSADPIAVLHFRTRLRLVVNLQNCAKAQASRAYARKVKLTNLQQMAATICYVQEHGFDTEADIEKERSMNLAAVDRINDSIKLLDREISVVRRNTAVTDAGKDRLAYLAESRKRLLSSRSNTQKYIRELQVVQTNIGSMLRGAPSVDQSRRTEKAQDLR